jgi:hypothetical protein
MTMTPNEFRTLLRFGTLAEAEAEFDDMLNASLKAKHDEFYERLLAAIVDGAAEAKNAATNAAAVQRVREVCNEFDREGTLSELQSMERISEILKALEGESND